MILGQFVRDISFTLTKGVIGTASGIYIANASNAEALAHSFGVYCAAVAGFLTVVSLALNVAKGIRNWDKDGPYKRKRHRK